MLYLLAAVGALTIAFILWRAFGPERTGVPTSRPTLAPDDDPDFLRRLNEQQRKDEEEK